MLLAFRGRERERKKLFHAVNKIHSCKQHVPCRPGGGVLVGYKTCTCVVKYFSALTVSAFTFFLHWRGVTRKVFLHVTKKLVFYPDLYAVCRKREWTTK